MSHDRSYYHRQVLEVLDQIEHFRGDWLLALELAADDLLEAGYQEFADKLYGALGDVRNDVSVDWIASIEEVAAALADPSADR